MKEKLNKADLRKTMRAKVLTWAQRSQAEQLQLSRQIQSHLQNILRPATGTWAGYQALCGEPDCEWASQTWTSRCQVRWAFPCVSGLSLRFLVPHQQQNFQDCFHKAAMGILEPHPSKCEEIAVASLEGALIPGLAFDRNGIRLGRGQGFYDRTLATFSGKKIGVAFSWQISDQALPAEKHDIPMDIVVTENEIIRRELTS